MPLRAVGTLFPLILLCAPWLLQAQTSLSPTPLSRNVDGKETPRDQIRLPNGKLQQEEILKQEHDRELRDARQLVELSQALQKDIEQAGADVLSISSIHRTEEIEKLAKRIRSRMRGY